MFLVVCALCPALRGIYPAVSGLVWSRLLARAPCAVEFVIAPHVLYL